MSMPKGLFELIRDHAREDIAELPIAQTEPGANLPFADPEFRRNCVKLGAKQLNARDESRGIKRKKSST
jgi:hypothetical protein